MTFNVGNVRTEPEKLTGWLLNCGAEIVGLQELTVQQAEAIEKTLSDLFPYRQLHGAGIPGKGLLSRYPILETEQLHIYPHRPDLFGLIEIHGKPLRVIVAHPIPPRLHRRGFSYTEATHHHVHTLTELATSGEPTVLMGDFNMLNWDRRHSHLKRAGLKDVFMEVGKGRGHTLPARVGWLQTFPFMRVDYIWVSPQIKPLSAWLGEYVRSDHLPVLAQLAWE